MPVVRDTSDLRVVLELLLQLLAVVDGPLLSRGQLQEDRRGVFGYTEKGMKRGEKRRGEKKRRRDRSSTRGWLFLRSSVVMWAQHGHHGDVLCVFVQGIYMSIAETDTEVLIRLTFKPGFMLTNCFSD